MSRAIPRRYLLPLAVASLLVAPSASATSLIQAYELARENDPQFRADFYGKQATDERYDQARAALLPQISANASYTETSQNIVSTDNEVFDSGSTSFPTTVYGISLEQSVYDYSRWAAFSQADTETQQAASELEVARQDLVLRVAERYFDALSLYENLSFLQAEKEEVSTNLAEARARYEDGLSREVDLLDAESRLLQVESRALEVESSLRDALNGLEEITGTLPNRLKPVRDDLELERPDPDDQQEWTRLGFERNPRLQAAELAMEVANQEVRVRRGGHLPTLGLTLSYENDDTEGSLFGGGSQVETQIARMDLNIPIYRGGRVASEVREGEQLIEVSRSQHDQVRRQLDREVRSGYQSILTAMSRERALSESLRTNERIVESRQVGYESGLTPLLDLLDAERELFFARSELAGARYDYLLGVLRLRHAAGVINTEDLQQIDTLLDESVDVLASQTLRY